MLTTTLIVALVAAQAAEPPPTGPSEVAAPAAPALEVAAPPAAPEVAAEVRRSSPAAPQRRLRWGLGAVTMPGQSGVGGAMEVGADIVWWGQLGLRGTVGLDLAQLWGSFWIAPEVVWRMGEGSEGFGPYLGGGLMLAMASIADDNLPLSHGAVGWRDDAAGGAPAGDGSTGAGISLNPFQLSAGPTVNGGIAIRAGRNVAVDLGLRYGLLFVSGVQHQIAFTLAVNAGI